MAVYTEVNDDDLSRFISGYGIGELTSYKGIAEGVENSNYLVVTTAGQYILTLYEKRVDPGELPFFLGLMEHLAGKGLSCPTPLRDSEGHNLRQLAGRPAAIMETLEGAIRRCDAVDASFAWDEGEGDRSLASWRRGHEAFFARNGGFSPDMELVCERFRLVEILEPETRPTPCRP